MKSKDRLFTYCIEEDARGPYVSIESYVSDVKAVQIPDFVDNIPVKELKPYVFAGNAHREVYLPGTIRRIGRYGFYNCRELNFLSFYSNIEDVGSGCFTGCHKVKTLEVTMTDDTFSCFREILSEFSEELYVIYHGEEEARLMFPEFYEEGVENTPARILMTEVHGSGIHYRNCFQGARFHFQEYDARFPMAKARESQEFSIKLALGRLSYPCQLSGNAKEEYKNYLLERQTLVVRSLIERQDPELLMWFLEDVSRKKRLGEEELQEALQFAQRKGDARICACLMEYQGRYGSRRSSIEDMEL